MKPMSNTEPNLSRYPSLRLRLAIALIILAILFTAAFATLLYLRFDTLITSILIQEPGWLFQVGLIFLVALALLIGGALGAVNYLLQPVIEIRDAAYLISHGDLRQRITKIPQTRELAELSINLNTMTADLAESSSKLEQRVAERTAELAQKVDYLRAASFIANQTAQTQSLYALLNTVVQLVSDQFGFYHTGIFLMNEAGSEAVLQAASSEGGRQLVAAGYTLPVGPQSIVGYVAAQKRPRLVLDIGPGAVFFNDPDLPMTRSQVALPLLIRNRVLGVLDIRSDEPQAFSEQDIDVLETLANQVAVAIDNARLLDESKATYMQLEALTSLRARESWNQKLHEQKRVFTYTPLGLSAEKLSLPEGNEVAVPINLRGQHIGKISLARKGDSQWNKADEDLLAEVASQVGLAVENIRLLEEATERARQEQLVGEMAFRFSQALDLDSLLQTAARELGQLPGVEEATVFIGQMNGQDSGLSGIHQINKSGRRDES
jgi:GAF domain-containing protein/HAMP domain-containing protein